MNESLPAIDCWFLTGPTASGKTPLGIELAERLGAEIISLDSMAIYRGMDIGTAKPTPVQRAVVPHHLIDVAEPAEAYSVFQYVEAAHAKVAEVRGRGRDVVFVGGSPLYLKALLRGLFRGPEADWEFRQSVRDELQTVGQHALHERLAQVDPLSAARLHPNDTRRLIRALEVYKLTGQPISHLQMQFDEGREAEQCRVFVLKRSQAEMMDRIRLRVEWMFEAGLVDEVRQLVSGGRQLGRTASQAVGYREALAHLDGRLSLDETRERVEQRTRRFAKHQSTWFRSLSECRPVELEGDDLPGDVADRVLRLAESG